MHIERSLANLRIAFLSLAAVACGGAQGSASEPAVHSENESPDDTATEDTTDEGAVAEAAASSSESSPATVRELLVAIDTHVRAGDMDSVRALVLDFTGPQGRPVAEEVIEGIEAGRVTGDWSFSLPALQIAIDRADEFRAPNEALGEQLTSTFGRLDARLAEASRFRVFEGGQGTHILLVQLESGAIRLVFWEGLAALDPASGIVEPGGTAESANSP
ncbi:MAG: hypothetical protein AAGF12_33195 [Myxococcota bacterium]